MLDLNNFLGHQVRIRSISLLGSICISGKINDLQECAGINAHNIVKYRGVLELG